MVARRLRHTCTCCGIGLNGNIRRQCNLISADTNREALYVESTPQASEKAHEQGRVKQGKLYTCIFYPHLLVRPYRKLLKRPRVGQALGDDLAGEVVNQTDDKLGHGFVSAGIRALEVGKCDFMSPPLQSTRSSLHGLSGYSVPESALPAAWLRGWRPAWLLLGSICPGFLG